MLDRQEALLKAVVEGHVGPAGFDAQRLALVRRGLEIKRRREALHCWPGLGDLCQEFDRFAGQHPRPPGGSPQLDGYAFARWMAARGHVSARLIVETFAIQGQTLRRRSRLERWCVRLARVVKISTLC